MRLSCIKVFLGYTSAMDIENTLREKKIKLTAARVTLLELLAGAPRPLCYEDIKERITMDKATFYRNMITFEEAGLLNAFESHTKMRYYELRLAPHAHFVCRICNGVECLEGVALHLPGYEISNVIVNGVCRRCGEGREQTS